MATGNSILKRLQAVEARRGRGVNRHPEDMTDNELWRALNIRDPETGALRKDLTDEELEERLRSAQERLRATQQRQER